MKRFKWIFALLAILGAFFAIFFVLRSDKALLVHPKGIIAHRELNLMVTQILLMLVVVVPTYLALFVVVWKYRAQNGKSHYDPEHSHGGLGQCILWMIPTVIIAVMAVVTWDTTHALDPYKPLESEVKPLKIQVVALDWKWLFIYPEQEIASVNFVQFPEKTPIQFELSADGSPMNSFWIPQLSGQIYAMSGMVTTLHMMADAPGVYSGRAAEINGDGFAAMTFVVQSSTQEDFDHWVDAVKKSPLQLTDSAYNELLRPSQNNPITLYSNVEKEMLNKIIMKYMHPQ